ncbi:MAG: electron transport complex subunit RsxA [Arsenophonus sp.]|nr:MAG: electron transport complex subunit RsxA [Arsenophonus sp.]
MKYYLLFIETAIVNNFILVECLGLCPFIGISKNIKSSISMALSTIFVMTLSASTIWLVNKVILEPLNLSFIRTLTFIFIIASIVQLTEMIIKKINIVIYKILGVFLPLITTNCAILNVVLLNINRYSNFLESLFFSFSASCGFAISIIIFGAIQQRLSITNIPQLFKGYPIVFITAGLVSLSFMGFKGIIK